MSRGRGLSVSLGFHSVEFNAATAGRLAVAVIIDVCCAPPGELLENDDGDRSGFSRSRTQVRGSSKSRARKSRATNQRHFCEDLSKPIVVFRLHTRKIPTRS